MKDTWRVGVKQTEPHPEGGSHSCPRSETLAGCDDDQERWLQIEVQTQSRTEQKTNEALELPCTYLPFESLTDPNRREPCRTTKVEEM